MPGVLLGVLEMFTLLHMRLVSLGQAFRFSGNSRIRAGQLYKKKRLRRWQGFAHRQKGARNDLRGSGLGADNLSKLRRDLFW